jgi:hypothetical protein
MGQTRIPSIDIQPQDPGAIVPGGTVTITLDDGGGFMAPAGATREQLRALVDQFVESQQSGTDFPFETFTGDSAEGWVQQLFRQPSGDEMMEALIHGLTNMSPEELQALPGQVRDFSSTAKDYGAAETIAGLLGAAAGGKYLGAPVKSGMAAVGATRAARGLYEGDDWETILKNAGLDVALEGVMPGVAKAVGTPIRKFGDTLLKFSLPKIESMLQAIGGRGGSPAGLDELIERIKSLGAFRMDEASARAASRVDQGEALVERGMSELTDALPGGGVPTMDIAPVVRAGEDLLDPAQGATRRRIGVSGDITEAEDVLENFQTTRILGEAGGGTAGGTTAIDDLIAQIDEAAQAARTATTNEARSAATQRSQQLLQELQELTAGGGGAARATGPVREFIPQDLPQVRRDLARTPMADPTPGAGEMTSTLRTALSDIFKKQHPLIREGIELEHRNIPVRDVLRKGIVNAASQGPSQMRFIGTTTGVHPFAVVPPGSKSFFTAGNILGRAGSTGRPATAIARALVNQFAPSGELERRRLTSR